MTTTPALPVLPPISLDVAILHRDLNQAKRNLADTLELFRTVALDVAHMTETVERKEAELAAAREVKATVLYTPDAPTETGTQA